MTCDCGEAYAKCIKNIGIK